jgi:organic hydroperoxide reductase OsmC/OhrA
MAKFEADVRWALKDREDFLRGRYSRGHTISFDRKTEIAASASPHVVGKWAGDATIDPEKMLVAALSSCHMMSFLHVARLAGFTVTAYDDHAEGVLEEIEPGRHAVTKAALHPHIAWTGSIPTTEELKRLHHDAHEICFVANSVKTVVNIE